MSSPNPSGVRGWSRGLEDEGLGTCGSRPSDRGPDLDPDLIGCGTSVIYL